MAKFLRPNPDADAGGNLTGPNWRLPATTDLEGLVHRLEDAISKGEAVTVDVEMSDDPRTRAKLVLNGARLDSAIVAEITDA